MPPYRWWILLTPLRTRKTVRAVAHGGTRGARPSLGATRTLPEGLATFREQLNGDLLLTIGVDERGERVVASVRPGQTLGAKDHLRMFFRGKSIAEVDQHNYFKLEVEKCGLADAFGMPWAQPALKDALLNATRTGWVPFPTTWRGRNPGHQRRIGSPGCIRCREDPQAAPAMVLKAREAERLKDAKMALTARNEARAELLDVSLPAPAPSRKGTPFRRSFRGATPLSRRLPAGSVVER